MTAARATRDAKPIPASIPMPDSPIRQHWLFQLFVRLARPALEWVGVFAAIYNLGLCDFLLKPVPDSTRIIVLAFVAALFGIRTLEKTKGVA